MVEKDPLWRPYPFINVWTGHLFVGILSALGVLIVLALSRWLFTPDVDFDTVMVLVFVGWFLTETISTIFDRWYVKLKQHHIPGGWIWATNRIVIFALVYTVTGFTLLWRSREALICGISAIVVAVIEAVALKKWRTGFDTAQTQEAMRKTKEMTIRIFSEDDDKRSSK